MSITTMNSSVPAAIERVIQSKGMKKCAVAERAGMSPQTFNDMLKGRRVIKVKDLTMIAKALEVAPGAFFTAE